MSDNGFQYTYNKEITKLPAFDDYLRKQYDPVVYNGAATSGNTTIVIMNRELTEAEQELLTTRVNAYTDPAVFLIYNRTESSPIFSHFANSSTPTPIQTLIFTNRNEDRYVLDGCKTILEYYTDDVTLFQNADDNNTINFQMYDVTRNWLLVDETIDLAFVVNKWKSLSNGSDTVYKSIYINGLHEKAPNYDCIWQFRISVSNPNMQVRMNGLQYIFYDVI